MASTLSWDALQSYREDKRTIILSRQREPIKVASTKDLNIPQAMVYGFSLAIVMTIYGSQEGSTCTANSGPIR